MPLPPPVIKIVLFVSFIIKYPALIKDARLPNTSDTIVLHRADPPWFLDDCVSQGPDPVFKPLCLHHHHLAVVGAERNSRHTLKGGEEVDREFSRILFMADGPELLLKPTHGLSEERRGLLRESAALLVQLSAQPAKRASSARQLLPVAVNALHESKQPLLGRTQPVQLVPECAKLRQTPLHHGLAEFVLGFEVVVDIAYRHASRLGDVRQTRLSETASIRQVRRSLNQPRSLVRLCRSHIF